MKSLLEYTVETISTINPLHGKKLKKNLKKFDDIHSNKANGFLQKYEILLKNKNQSIDFAVECYLQMLADINYESVQFLQTGEYSSKSFDEVNARVYNNPEVMEYYMHGLLLSQFLWTHHYNVFTYFCDIIEQYCEKVTNYLEIGAGHGLYISEAIESIGDNARFHVVDISQSSIEMAQLMINNPNVSFTLTDIFEYHPLAKYDFITMGEVLEHVEDPIKLLSKVSSFLDDEGRLFITTPTNSPTIDHIYLFKNSDDIRKVIFAAGFNIEHEICFYSEDLSKEIAEEYKIPMMYAAVLTKKTKQAYN